MPIKTLLLLVLLAAVWGASFIFMRIAAAEFGAIALIQVRVLIATAVLLPIWYVREGAKNWHQVRDNWSKISVLGMLNSAIPFTLFAYSTIHISGGLSAVFNSTVPIWTATVAFVWLGHKLAWDGVLGLVLGLFGVIILLADSIGTPVVGVEKGIAAALLGSFFYGIAANFTVQKMQGISILTIATFTLLASSLLLLPLTVFALPEGPISSRAWFAAIALGVLPTALANVLYFQILNQIGSTKTVSVTYLIPVFAVLWGWWFLDEKITQQMILGAVVILLGTSLVTGVISLSRRSSSK